MSANEPEIPLHRFIQQLPKAELHLHLEGSIDAQTMQEIDPALTLDEIRTALRFSDFGGFIQTYIWVSKKLTTPAAYRIAARRLLENLILQGVVAVEITLSAGVILWKGQALDAIFKELQAETNLHPAIRVRWIFDAVRQFGVDPAREVFLKAAAYSDAGVVAIGLGGDETRGPAAWFSELYSEAKRAGLCLACHAGEVTGPESVWEAVRIGATRIGHGIRAVHDSELMSYLAEHQIALEVCPSSNVATRAVASLQEHPLRKLWDAGIPIVIGTDDPALFATDLNREYAIAAEVFSFSRDELRLLAANSLRFSFDPVIRALGQPALPATD